MNTLSTALTAILLLALVLFMAPNIFRLNRGKVLRNIAIWLAIFAILGIGYQMFGPGADPDNSMGKYFRGLTAQSTVPVAPQTKPLDAPPPVADDKNKDKQGFTPPAE